LEKAENALLTSIAPILKKNPAGRGFLIVLARLRLQGCCWPAVMGRGDLSEAKWEVIGPLLPPGRVAWHGLLAITGACSMEFPSTAPSCPSAILASTSA